MGRHVSVICAVMLSLLSGCWRGPAPVQTFPGVARGVDVVALDEAAWQLVAIQSRSVSTNPDGRMTIKLELANLSSLDVDIQVQALFRDAQGMPVAENPPFEMIVLPGGGSRLYEVSSVHAGTGSFTIQLQTP